jgi:hypothetical protein
MSGTSKFFHDRVVLLLVSTNTFLTLVSSIATLIRISHVHSQGFIGEYRANLGLSAFKPGSASTFAGFVIFMLLILVFHTLLARRVYHLRRGFSYCVLALGTLLITLAAIVSYALLGLS